MCNYFVRFFHAFLMLISWNHFAFCTSADYEFSEQYKTLYQEYAKDTKKFVTDINAEKEMFYKTYENNQLKGNTEMVIHYAVDNTDHMSNVIHKMRYETLVYAFAFAKEHHTERSFFLNAFPREAHCIPSQVTPVQSWLMAEKEALKVSSSGVAEQKLSINIRDLFQTNAFLGARMHNIILYWFAPRCINFFQSKYPGIKPMSLRDYEEYPQNLATYFSEFEEDQEEIDTQASIFSAEIYDLLGKEAKSRFIELWNAPDVKTQPLHRYHLSRENATLYTEDSYICVKFSDGISTENIAEADVSLVYILNSVLKDGVNIYIDMREYLKNQFKKSFVKEPPKNAT